MRLLHSTSFILIVILFSTLVGLNIARSEPGSGAALTLSPTRTPMPTISPSPTLWPTPTCTNILYYQDFEKDTEGWSLAAGWVRTDKCYSTQSGHSPTYALGMINPSSCAGRTTYPGLEIHSPYVSIPPSGGRVSLNYLVDTRLEAKNAYLYFSVIADTGDAIMIASITEGQGVPLVDPAHPQKNWWRVECDISPFAGRRVMLSIQYVAVLYSQTIFIDDVQFCAADAPTATATPSRTPTASPSRSPSPTISPSPTPSPTCANILYLQDFEKDTQGWTLPTGWVRTEKCNSTQTGHSPIYALGLVNLANCSGMTHAEAHLLSPFVSVPASGGTLSLNYLVDLPPDEQTGFVPVLFLIEVENGETEVWASNRDAGVPLVDAAHPRQKWWHLHYDLAPFAGRRIRLNIHHAAVQYTQKIFIDDLQFCSSVTPTPTVSPSRTPTPSPTCTNVLYFQDFERDTEGWTLTSDWLRTDDGHATKRGHSPTHALGMTDRMTDPAEYINSPYVSIPPSGGTLSLNYLLELPTDPAYSAVYFFLESEDGELSVPIASNRDEGVPLVDPAHPMRNWWRFDYDLSLFAGRRAMLVIGYGSVLYSQDIFIDDVLFCARPSPTPP